MSRILAIDYGTRRIGLAISDENEIIASPLEVITPKITKDPIDYIIKKTEELGCKIIVLGVPYALDGKLSPMTKRVLSFKKKLQEKYRGEIILVDERFTSKEAETVLLQYDMRRSNRKKVIDKIAATIILQTYLDMRNSNER